MLRLLPARFDVAQRLGSHAVVNGLIGRGPWARLWLRWRLRWRPGWRLGGPRVTNVKPAWALRPMAGADIRPIWEANRWAELPRLALEGRGGEIAPWLDSWLAANPPFLGPNWGCGQEAALRALHLALAARLSSVTAPRAVMASLARRIGANPAYALAQDNNHPISEAAGLLVCGLALQDASLAARGARRLDTSIARLVAEDGSFAQASPAYHRMLLDVMAVTQWLRREGPPAAPLTQRRMAAATLWLHRMACPQTGRLPRIGHQDGSHVADLSGAGPDDARASLERAARIFCGASAGWPDDPGCAAMGLPLPDARLTAAGDWRSAGFLGRRSGHARAILRTGPLRFRPGHADLLHLDVWAGSANLLRDGGTGAYNPADPGWINLFQGTQAHNIICFDGEDQMPRLGPFLFSHWPETGDLPDGAWLRDHRGRTQAREVFAEPWGFRVEDRIGGPFAQAVLRWRLAPDDWHLTEDGVAGPAATIRIAADGPFVLRFLGGVESLAYGQASALPVLEVGLVAADSRITTKILIS